MSDSRTLNEKVVYNALSRMTKDRTTLSMAFTRWRENFSNQSLDVIALVDDLVNYLGLGIEEKKALMIGLHAASNRLESELLSVPEFLSAADQVAEVKSAADDRLHSQAKKNVAAHIEVAQLYLQGLVDRLKRSDKRSYKEMAAEIAKQGVEGAPKVADKSLRDWAKNSLDGLTLNSRMSEQECQETAHEFYVLLSDFVGPVAADDMVSKITSELMQTDLAQRYDVRDLL